MKRTRVNNIGTKNNLLKTNSTTNKISTFPLKFGLENNSSLLINSLPIGNRNPASLPSLKSLQPSRSCQRGFINQNLSTNNLLLGPYNPASRTPTPLRSPNNQPKSSSKDKAIQKVLEWNCHDYDDSAAETGTERQNSTRKPARARGTWKRVDRINSKEVLEEARKSVKEEVQKKLQQQNYAARTIKEKSLEGSGSGQKSSKTGLSSGTGSDQLVREAAKHWADKELGTSKKEVCTNKNSPPSKHSETSIIRKALSSPKKSKILLAQIPFYRQQRVERRKRPGGGDEFSAYIVNRNSNQSLAEAESNDEVYERLLSPMPPVLPTKLNSSSPKSRVRIWDRPPPRFDKEPELHERQKRLRKEARERQTNLQLNRIIKATQELDAKETATSSAAKSQRNQLRPVGRVGWQSDFADDESDVEQDYSIQRIEIGSNVKPTQSLLPPPPEDKKLLALRLEKIKMEKEQASRQAILDEQATHLNTLKSQHKLLHHQPPDWNDNAQISKSLPKASITLPLLKSKQSFQYNQPRVLPPRRGLIQPTSPLQRIYGAPVTKFSGQTYKERRATKSQNLQNEHLYNNIKNAKSEYSRDKQLIDYKKHQAHVICSRPVANLRNVGSIQRANVRAHESSAAAQETAVGKSYYKLQ